MIPIMRWLARLLLQTRYRVTLKGVETVAQKGKRGILFLSNHPALIDPILTIAYLHGIFEQRFLADEDQVSVPFVDFLARTFKVVRIPNAASRGSGELARVDAALAECASVVNEGGCLILAPAGHILRCRHEELGANSGVETILRQAPNARVVLLNTAGLWGSSMSRASGEYPKLGNVFRNVLKTWLFNLGILTPRRSIEIELFEPGDFPYGADRNVINRFLEDWYNGKSSPNTYVPYRFWERGGVRILPEPKRLKTEFDPDSIPPETRRIVDAKIREICGQVPFTPETSLVTELGMDSLNRLELTLWIEKEFGYPAPNPDSIDTMAELYAAASGESLANRVDKLKDVPASWFSGEGRTGVASLPQPDGDLVDLFLAAAAAHPDFAVIADQSSGVRTYRDIIVGINVLRPEIADINGEYVGIMLPASVAACVVYLATLFAGKTPVMLNWTVGERNLDHVVDLLGLNAVLTSRKLVEKLKSQGVGLGKVGTRLVNLEDVAARIPTWKKLLAATRSRLSWRHLHRSRRSSTAVVLFTSGSESLPKAVPLSHANIIANIRDVLSIDALKNSDAIIGFLPPFHSFGITATMLLPVLSGVRAVYHPNPTEAGTLSRIIRLYRSSVLIGTPTFVGGILKSSSPEDLATLRIGVTGAEKCPEHVYAELGHKCPGVVVLEGYGITECSPVVALNRPECPMPGSIGKLLPSLSGIVVDPESGEPMPPNGRGMLLVKGPSIFSGYLNYDGPSPFVENDGETYYRTGDLVSVDENGNLFFQGRLKRFIKLGGEMISLPAIEEVLLAAFQRESDEGPCLAVTAFGEEKPEIVLFSTRTEISRERANETIRNAGLSALHNIRRIENLAAIPLLGSGKTNYRALKV